MCVRVCVDRYVLRDRNTEVLVLDDDCEHAFPMVCQVDEFSAAFVYDSVWNECSECVVNWTYEG